MLALPGWYTLSYISDPNWHVIIFSLLAWFVAGCTTWRFDWIWSLRVWRIYMLAEFVLIAVRLSKKTLRLSIWGRCADVTSTKLRRGVWISRIAVTSVTQDVTAHGYTETYLNAFEDYITVNFWWVHCSNYFLNLVLLVWIFRPVLIPASLPEVHFD